MNGLRPAVLLLLLLAASVPVLASEEEGGLGAALITPHYGTIFWTLVTFLLMVVLLKKFAWKPLIGALDARETSIRDTIEQANTDREQSKQQLEEHRQLVTESRRERAQALEQGRQDAEKLKDEILAEAQNQRVHLMNQTQEQIKTEMQQAKDELRGVTVELAIKAAEKLLTRNIDDAAQRQLVEEYLTGLEGNESPGTRPS